MKNIFALNDTDPNNEVFDGQLFLCAEIPATQQQICEEFDADSEQLAEKAQLPKPLQILMVVAGVAALLCILVFVKLLDGEEPTPLYWFLIPAAIAGAVFLLLFVLARRKNEDVLKSREFAILEENSDRIDRENRAFLGVPENTPMIDIFTYTYKIKNGKEKRDRFLFDFLNMELSAFCENNTLYLADISSKYGIPLHDITGIRCIDKKVRFPLWNKEEAPNKGIYKPFKIREDDSVYYMKPYYALDILHGGEEYELLFPGYELATIEKLTGLKAPEIN